MGVRRRAEHRARGLSPGRAASRPARQPVDVRDRRPESGTGPRSGRAALAVAALYLTAQVARVRIGGREVPVPFHGYLPVATTSPRGNPVTALGSDGMRLETLDLRRSTALYREQRQRSPSGWPHRARRL